MPEFLESLGKDSLIFLPKSANPPSTYSSNTYKISRGDFKNKFWDFDVIKGFSDDYQKNSMIVNDQPKFVEFFFSSSMDRMQFIEWLIYVKKETEYVFVDNYPMFKDEVEDFIEYSCSGETDIALYGEGAGAYVRIKDDDDAMMFKLRFSGDYGFRS